MKRSTQSDFDFFYPPDTYIDPRTGAVGVRDATTGTVTRGEQFLLNDYIMKAVMTSGGYGMPDMKWMEQTGPFQHGNTLLDYRLMPRTISLEFIQTSTSLAQYWTDRAKLLDVFRISRQPRAGVLGLARLRKIMPDNSVRDIDVTFYGGMKFDYGGLAEDFRSPTNTIDLYAPDPTFYDPVILTQSVVLNSTTDLDYPKQIKGWARIALEIDAVETAISYNEYGTPNLTTGRLTAGTPQPVVGEILIIEAEKCLVTSWSQTSINTGLFIVQRGYGGTTAASHIALKIIAVTKDPTLPQNYGITSVTYEPWQTVFDQVTTLSITVGPESTVIEYAPMVSISPTTGLPTGVAIGDVLFVKTPSGLGEKMLVTSVPAPNSRAIVTRGYDNTTPLAHLASTAQIPTVVTVTAASQIAMLPTALGLVFGQASLADGFNVNYQGTWGSFPTITVVGPWDNFAITNVATLETISLGYNINALEIVTFDLRYGVKTVTNDQGTNLIGSVSSDSDLATFHLTPDAEITTGLADGINPIMVTGNNLTNFSGVVMEWYTRYIGI